MSSRFSPTLAVYLGRRFFNSVLITSVVLGAFVFLMDFIEMTRRLSGKDSADGELALQLVLLKMPDLLLQIAPFAILIGTMMAFSRLTRDQELIAIRAAGLPARQFLIPPLVVCLVIGLFNLALMNPFAAATLKSHQRISNNIFPGSTEGLVTEGGHIWLKQPEGEREMLIYANAVKNDGHLLEDASVFIFNQSGDFIRRIDSPAMRLKDQNWALENPLILEPDEPAQRQQLLVLPTELTPEMIQNSFTSPRTLSVWELREFIDLLEATGFPTMAHEMHWQRLLATPLLVLAMFLLGAPFALHFSRSRSLASMLLMGLVFGFGFYLFTNFISAYGMAGRLNIVLAAWLPTLIAGLLGLALFLHFREE